MIRTWPKTARRLCRIPQFVSLKYIEHRCTVMAEAMTIVELVSAIFQDFDFSAKTLE